MTLLLERPDVQVHHADWSALLEAMPRREDGTVCDALIVDAPYSERTHAGHTEGTSTANRSAEWAAGTDPKRAARSGTAGVLKYGAARRDISYASWGVGDVSAFVEAHARLTAGWFVALTDHVLASAWADAMESVGRYVFSPIACVEQGSRVRMVGDGPSQWSTWAVVSRPRRRDWLDDWRGHRLASGLGCSLPGGYVVPVGHGEHRPGLRRGRVVGGKPLWLMRALVRDYTRPGDLVCDPCCGAGTTLLAAVQEGRRAVGGDALEAHAQLAAQRLGGLVQIPLLGGTLG